MGSSFCILPFIHLEIQPNGNVSACCHSNTPQEYGSLFSSDIKSIWNGEKRKKFIDLFDETSLSNIQHCKDCSLYESLGVKSWRMVENENWKHISAENKEELISLSGPKSITIRFSNLCNFSCRTCRPSTSTSWFSDAKFLNPKGEYKKIYSAPKGNSIKKQLIPMLEGIEHIHFLGGEPLLEKEHYEILEILAEKYPEIILSYDTNLSVLELGQYKVLNLWKRMKDIHLSASIDGFGSKGEYIRKGLSWKIFLSNWQTVKNELPHIKMKMNSTLSILNMFHITDFIDEVKRLDMFSNNSDMGLTISLVEFPEWQSLQALPQEVKKMVENHYKEYFKNNTSFGKTEEDLNIAVKFMYGDDKSRLINTFKNFNSKLDFLRGERFKALFPKEAEVLNIN